MLFKADFFGSVLNLLEDIDFHSCFSPIRSRLRKYLVPELKAERKTSKTEV